ncbi:MAG: acyl-CoA dehydrogenase C-terminal domain-containing protein [Gammaproteobacteria bacterium]|nr:acyl-CoA dehydrogenase C-terminal domain-containing protein [Gammaproteobacteria bacterium]
MPVSLNDMRFLIHDVLGYEQHYQSLGLNDPPNRELIDAIIDEAARFTETELAPLNESGDVQGCRIVDGRVITPDGFKRAYEIYIKGGWAGLSGDPAYGGQGLPDSVSIILEELMCGANMAWSMYPGLSRGTINVLESYGSDEQKQTYLTRLLTGEWTGTMCLTEAQAGSDVGLAKTRAAPTADGGYAVSGTKIFISAGDHDMAENIVHLVLARLPDAPAGTKGISMFVVPKINLDGSPNNVTCGGIEKKMGIHGNATCVLHFEEAKGYLIGEPNEGMRYMFTLMNGARVVVGLQGVCLAQSAYLMAADYAADREQMRSLSGPKAPDRPADPILVHPDVRRMLLVQKSIVEGGRALIYYTGQLADQVAAYSGEEQARAEDLLDFLTPIVKGFLTELGFESVNHAMQIFGGHGFIRETGVEQYVRDARITMIYEGTTQIQALDLLGRKVLLTQGKGLTAFIDEINDLAGEIADSLPDLSAKLKSAAREWSGLTLPLAAKAQQNLDELGAAAVDYLFYSGYVTLAYCWARIARTAAEGDENDRYLAGKLATARFYFARMLPRAGAHKIAMEAGADVLMSISDEALTST